MTRWIATLTLVLLLVSFTPVYAAGGLSVELDKQFLNTSLDLDGFEYLDGDGNATILRANYQFNKNWGVGLDYTWAESNDDVYLDYPPITSDADSNLLSAQVQYTHAFSDRFSLGLQAGYQRFDLQETFYGYKLADVKMDGFFLGAKTDLAFTPKFGLEASYRVMLDPSTDVTVYYEDIPIDDESFQELDIAARYDINPNNTLKLGYRAIYAGFDVSDFDYETDYEADYKADGFYVGLQHKF